MPQQSAPGKYFVRPVGAMSIVDEVGNIERDVLAANDDEVPGNNQPGTMEAVLRREVNRLISR